MVVQVYRIDIDLQERLTVGERALRTRFRLPSFSTLLRLCNHRAWSYSLHLLTSHILIACNKDAEPQALAFTPKVERERLNHVDSSIPGGLVETGRCFAVHESLCLQTFPTCTSSFRQQQTLHHRVERYSTEQHRRTSQRNCNSR